MPILIAVVGAISTGFMYWLLWGDGLAYLEHRLGSAWAGKRRARLLAAAERSRALAPLAAVDDPRDAAGILLFTVARARGTPTPEQEDAIANELRDVLGFGVERRMAYARFGAGTGLPPVEVVDALAPLLRKKLARAERADLSAMLARVAAVHGGPTDAQARVVELLDAALKQEW
jgi:uncharacterized tellurite resistance protein B-like protein